MFFLSFSSFSSNALFVTCPSFSSFILSFFFIPLRGNLSQLAFYRFLFIPFDSSILLCGGVPWIRKRPPLSVYKTVKHNHVRSPPVYVSNRQWNPAKGRDFSPHLKTPSPWGAPQFCLTSVPPENHCLSSPESLYLDSVLRITPFP